LIDQDLHEPQCLILTPTRELALQNRDVIKTMSEHILVKIACLIGGNSVEEDIKKIQEGAQIIVGTPGRV